MTQEPRPGPSGDQSPDDRFESVVGRKARRRIAARDEGDRAWFWLGMIGLIGWSVTIPTMLGVALGLWLDTAVPTGFSWTLSMLFVGLVVGVANAWFWVQQESDDRPAVADTSRGGEPTADEGDAPDGAEPTAGTDRTTANRTTGDLTVGDEDGGGDR